MRPEEIYQAVRERYSTASQGSAGGKYESAVAKSFGYSEDELGMIPKDANLGLSCGNPHAMASLKEGEVVIDFGCGAGFDVFLAAHKVGKAGKAIGVDMNEDMLAKASRNMDLTGAENVQFVHAAITDVSHLSTGSADCIISNCVINLVPEEEKQLVFNEMARLLRPGGRVAISDILLKTDLPSHLQDDLALYVGCIAGASKVQDYEVYFKNAGFKDVLIIDTGSDLNVYQDLSKAGEGPSCCGNTCEQCGNNCCTDNGNGYASCCQGSSEGLDLNEKAGSFKIYAVNT